jgi:MFS family permease
MNPETPNSLSMKHDPYAALRHRDFRLLWLGSFVGSFGAQMVGVAIGWELYERTHSELALGLVGLVQVLPVLLLSLPAGQLSDLYNRKAIVLASEAMLGVCALGLAWLSYRPGALLVVYGLLGLIGVARAFGSPATDALMPSTVPVEVFGSAATWSSSAWQFAAVFGPALSGLMIALFHVAWPVFLISALSSLVFILLLVLIQGRPVALSQERASVKMLLDGVAFIRRTQIILATITLDLFAVLLGGAVTLLPVYAKDILAVGPSGLGLLQAAPSVGALVMALGLAHAPPFRRAGLTLLLAVAGFGAATIVFGLSTSFWLSMAMLAALGALDNISVVIRNSLVIMRTPDEMRGRIAAVNNIFIGASNQLGGFESGVTAQLFGPVWSVVGGGAGTILVVLIVAAAWPEVRRLKRLNED